MPLYRAFVQPAPTPVAFPTIASPIVDAALTVTSSMPLSGRTDARRRSLIIKNKGTVPILFAYGATVSATAFTERLEPGDSWEDTTNWQGAIAAMSIGGAGSANITELLIAA